VKGPDPTKPASDAVFPRPNSEAKALPWVIAAFLIASVLAAAVLIRFGPDSRGLALALRATARFSFVLFWLAYVGGALRSLFGTRLWTGFARRGRQFGLAFASAQLIHIGLILWLSQIATESLGLMSFFWLGIVCTYVLALLSLQPLQRMLGPRIWRVTRFFAVEYIALVFAYDFIWGPLLASGGRYPLSYLPFALMLICGAGLRLAALGKRFWVNRAAPPITPELADSHRASA
jgi:hypothetical protein